MKATIELCHQKCRLIQACSHNNQVGIYLRGVGGGRCIEASHFNKGMYSASAVSLGVITVIVIREKNQIILDLKYNYIIIILFKFKL
jgi:hypothetical protein